jgi:hypothetical protein
MAKRGFIKYKSYLFVDKDPIIDALRGPISASKMSYSEINEAGGPAAATLRNWFSGETRRPQFATVAATARTIGKRGIRFASSGNPYLVD